MNIGDVLSGLKLRDYNISQARNNTNIYDNQDGIVTVLSCLDHLDHEFYFENKDLYIYAESLVIPKQIKAKNIFISINEARPKEGTETGILQLDVSGKDGKPGESGNINGKDGTESGDIFCYMENIGFQLTSHNYFEIKATGGFGGSGFDVDEAVYKVEADEGLTENKNDEEPTQPKEKTHGGNGGNGGKVDFFVSHQALILAEEIFPIRLKATLAEKKELFDEVSEELKYVPFEEVSKAVKDIHQHLFETKKDKKPNEEGIINNLEKYFALLEKKTKFEYLSCSSWISNQDVDIHVYGGVGGVGEQRGNNGKNGLKELSIKSIISQNKIHRILSVHPLHCAMLLNRARLEYVFMNPIDFKHRKKIRTLFAKLYMRTKPFAENFDTQIEKTELLWNKEHVKDLVLDNRDCLAKINLRALDFLQALDEGKDVYGDKSNYVYLMPIKHIRDKFLPSLFENFEAINNAFEEFSNKELEDKEKIAKANLMDAALQSKLNQTHLQLNILRNEIIKSIKYIDQYNNLAMVKKPIVEALLEKYKEELSHFDFQMSDLLRALSTVAFAPTSLVMWTSQAMELAWGGYESTTDDTGVKIRKDYLIRKVGKIQKDFKSLTEGFKKEDDGVMSFDDPSSDKLLAVREVLFSQLDTKLEKHSEDLRKEFNDYVVKITNRNTEILNYNNCIRIARKLVLQEEQDSNSIDNIHESLSLVGSENIKYIEEQISLVYYSIRENVLKAMNIAQKAYKLFTLEEKPLFSGMNIANMDNTSKSDIMTKILVNLNDFITTHPVLPNKFEIQEYTYNDKINITSFKNDHKNINFTLDYFELGDQLGAFKMFTRIRISRVYVRFDGIKSKKNEDAELRVIVTHGEESIFVREDAKHVHLYHLPITCSFACKLSQPDKAFVEFLFTGDAGAPMGGGEELLSPFTEWTIELENFQDFDLSKVDSVTLGFEGTHCK